METRAEATPGEHHGDDANSDFRGLSDLVTLTVERVTAPVEGMHRAIVDRSMRWIGPAGAPVRRLSDVFIAGIYDMVRATGSALGAGVEIATRIAGPQGRAEAGVASGSGWGSRLQAFINAVWGDELEERDSGLGIEMALRNRDGRPVELTTSDLAATFPLASPHVVVLVHGLGQTESCWQGGRDGGPIGLWDLLSQHQSVTPVSIRYNTGRHVSDNGRDLAGLLDELWRTWPMPIERLMLIGHSMGGLVVRSACHAGRVARLDWVEAVGRVITVGSPHLGAPLEKAANLASWGLRIAPESRPLADFLDARSVGIKDLRFGATIEEDWWGVEPDALLRNTVAAVPPLEDADHRFVTGVITSDPLHPVGILLGDLMVRAGSGTGRGRRRRIEATEVRVLGGQRHFKLLQDHRLLDLVMAWVSDT